MYELETSARKLLGFLVDEETTQEETEEREEIFKSICLEFKKNYEKIIGDYNCVFPLSKNHIDKIREIKFENLLPILQEVVEYDFINEYRHYDNGMMSNEKKADIINEHNPTLKLLKYKNSYDGYESSKNASKYGFDCDDWNGTCGLARRLYEKLWGWDYVEDKFTNKQKENTPRVIKGELKTVWEKGNVKTNSDTMNSYAKTVISALGARSIKDLEENYNLYSERINDVYREFALFNHTIGNLTVIPYYAVFYNGERKSFNGTRAFCGCIKDFWDLSLVLLRDEQNFGSELFKEYVDIFLQWDYVDDNYEPLPLFAGHLDKDANVMPQNAKDFKDFFINVTERIKARGTLIVIILMLTKMNEKAYL